MVRPEVQNMAPISALPTRHWWTRGGSLVDTLCALALLSLGLILFLENMQDMGHLVLELEENCADIERLFETTQQHEERQGIHPH